MKANWIACVSVSAAIVMLSPLSPISSAPRQCPNPRQLTAAELAELKTQMNKPVLALSDAAALVGVDALGRVTIAVDADKDGASEQLILYTDQVRLKGPWTRYLYDAEVQINQGSVLVTSRTERLAISVAVSAADRPAVPRWAKTVVVRGPGRELVRLFDDKNTVQLASLDNASIDSWPAAFHGDLLDPNTKGPPGCGGDAQICDDTECTGGGGFPSNSCSVGGCTGTPNSCSVSGCTGLHPSVFACCNCKGGTGGDAANCRCKSCVCK